MSPGFVIAGVLVAFTGGALFYSYQQGVTRGGQVCEAEKLAAKLEKVQNEFNLSRQLTEFQQEQISEAQIALEKSKDESAQLQSRLDSINTSSSSECIPDSVLDAIRKFRQGGKGKNP